MNFPPGIGDTDSIVNLDEMIGKVVGTCRPTPPQEAYSKLLRLGRSITGGRVPHPKGVFFFKTFQEADKWEMLHILNHARRLSQELPPSKM